MKLKNVSSPLDVNVADRIKRIHYQNLRPVVERLSLMREATLNQLKILVTILGQCLISLHSDFKNIDCASDLAKQVIPIIIDKLKRLVEIAGYVKRLCTSVKREEVSCLPCLGIRKEK